MRRKAALRRAARSSWPLRTAHFTGEGCQLRRMLAGAGGVLLLVTWLQSAGQRLPNRPTASLQSHNARTGLVVWGLRDWVDEARRRRRRSPHVRRPSVRASQLHGGVLRRGLLPVAGAFGKPPAREKWHFGVACRGTVWYRRWRFGCAALCCAGKLLTGNIGSLCERPVTQCPDQLRDRDHTGQKRPYWLVLKEIIRAAPCFFLHVLAWY
jgi:hypothetical protein